MTALAPPAPAGAQVVSLEARRITSALGQRRRYRYVRPRVVREGQGWKVVSPNCSRTIDASGGEIDIALLLPETTGRGWTLFARDHAKACWIARHREPTLAAVLAHLCDDPGREFWQ